MTHTLREATPADIPDLLRLVRDLAAYENEPDAVEATKAMYAAALFPSDGSTPIRVNLRRVGYSAAARRRDSLSRSAAASTAGACMRPG